MWLDSMPIMDQSFILSFMHKFYLPLFGFLKTYHIW